MADVVWICGSDGDTFARRGVPARHRRQCVVARHWTRGDGVAGRTNFKAGELRRWCGWSRTRHHRCRGLVADGGSWGFVVVVVEVLVRSAAGVGAAAEAVAATLEEREAGTTAGEAAAGATDDTADDREENERADDNADDNWPSEIVSSFLIVTDVNNSRKPPKFRYMCLFLARSPLPQTQQRRKALTCNMIWPYTHPNSKRWCARLARPR